MKTLKSSLGVTLLEVMLVLAIAAMIIVMSIRYYQTTNSSQQANIVAQSIQGVIATSDNLAQGRGGYKNAEISTTTIKPLMPSGSLVTPWGSDIAIDSATGNTITISVDNTPPAICALLKARYISNQAFTGVSNNACTSTAKFTLTYDSGHAGS